MTSIPPSGGYRQRIGGTGSIRGEAAARGVSEYQVRRERAAAGTGARVSRIPWNSVEDKQAQSIRETLPRNRWRAAVEQTLDNYRHYNETGDKQAEYDYKGRTLRATRYTEDDVDEWIEEHGEEPVSYLFWYHPSAATRRRL